MRTEKALKNTIYSFASYFILVILGFITQRVFKDALGTEYLGINSVFTNIISGLNVVELGFGSAIVANMYRPVAENDYGKISALLGFYKKIYRYVALTVLIVGAVMMPFIPVIIRDTTVTANLRLLFALYLFDSVISYFLTYKRSVLYANQLTYYTTIVHTCAVVTANIIQIGILLYAKSFIGYLITSIGFRLIENLIINAVVNRKFEYAKSMGSHSLDPGTINDIKKKVKGLLVHKVGNFVVTGTDNIIISMMPNLGIIWAGLYSSYAMITIKLGGLIDNIFNSITASVGNLLVEEDKEKSYQVFLNIKYINTWIYVFFAVSFFYISFPFIEIWMGRDFVLDPATVLVITINLFLGGMRACYNSMKNAAGIFYEDRVVPIIESSINILTSIPLAYVFGLKGVLMGTICSTMFLYSYSYPKFIYGMIFDKTRLDFWRDFIKSIILFCVSMATTGAVVLIVRKFTDNTGVIVRLLVTVLICAVVPNLTMFITTKHTGEFGFARGLIGKTLKKQEPR